MGGKKRRRRHLEAYFEKSRAVQGRMARTCLDSILAAADIVTKAFGGGNKLLLCGNGGAAAECQHMAAELVGRLRRDFERPPLPAIALTTDTSFLTAFSNDCGYDGVFERQVRALGRPGDVLLAISTSGTSSNVLRAVRVAASMGLVTVGVSGRGGVLRNRVACAIVLPSTDTRHLQECILPVLHVVCQLAEHALFDSSPAH